MGSEMCIRDRGRPPDAGGHHAPAFHADALATGPATNQQATHPHRWQTAVKSIRALFLYSGSNPGAPFPGPWITVYCIKIKALKALKALKTLSPKPPYQALRREPLRGRVQ